MKIAIVSLDNSEKILSGGKHIHQQLLEIGLNNMNHQVEKYFPRRSYWYLICRLIYLFLGKFKISDKGIAYEWSLKYFEKDLIKQLKSKKFEKVFAQDPVSAVAAKKAMPSCELTMTLHGYLSLESINYGYFSEIEKKRVLASALKYENESLAVADHIISVDSKIAKYLLDELKCNKKVTILKNAINPNLFNRLDQNEKLLLRKKHAISPDSKVILVPRRLVKKNGVHVALSAMSKLRKLDIIMLVMGDGPELSKLKTLKNDLELLDSQVKFLGSIDHNEAVKYYDLADIVLVPSVISDGVEEATSLSMLEGMAAKKIVIVSAIGGMKEVIKSGVNGFSFEQNNNDQLANLIIEILQTPHEALMKVILQGYNDVCEQHHFQRHAEKYIKATS